MVSELKEVLVYLFILRIVLNAGIRVKSYLLLLCSDMETAANIRSQWTFIQLNKPLWTFEALKDLAQVVNPLEKSCDFS